MEDSGQRLVNKIRDFVTDKYDGPAAQCFTYHCLNHVKLVVESVEKIGEACGLSEREMDALRVAAWVHDVGYMDDPEDHENASAAIATELLKEEGADQEFIDLVRRLILATKVTHPPKDLLEEIINDADLAHLGRPSFPQVTELLRKEFSGQRGRKVKKREWQNINLNFLRDHEFFTDYAKEHWDPVKQENIRTLEKIIKEGEKGGDKKKKSKKKKAKESVVAQDQKPNRAVDGLFRIMERNHINLSNIADGKSNIMISINSLIISLVVGVLFRKLEDYPNLLIPSIIFAITGLVSLIFAVLAIRPNVAKPGAVKLEDVKAGKVNLLFFGNFYSLKLQDYMEAMENLIQDHREIYRSLTKDIYYLGVVLSLKYKFLRLSYTCFMFGLIVTVLAFIIAVVLFPVKYPY
ncbi:hypothetical protein FUAX_43170 (plasmid) [Fulvitalea axinellae]|uniref:HD domain-containing protein n=1 Tax=Fulvitalea axinellae TaxID=1182444 RepID=A0AAU9CR69_9BACT|nr:hypothetical protein FUAX_43170 [Fulvitalea axinellae]